MFNLLLKVARMLPADLLTGPSRGDGTQLSRLVNMRMASSQRIDGCGDGGCDGGGCVCGTNLLSNMQSNRSSLLREQDGERYGRKFWSNTGEGYKPPAEREGAAPAQLGKLDAMAKKGDLISPLAQAELEWDAWNNGDSASETDEFWILNYAKTLEEIEAIRDDLNEEGHEEQILDKAEIEST